MKIEKLLDIVGAELDTFYPDDPRKKVFLMNIQHKIFAQIQKDNKESQELADEFNKISEDLNQKYKDIDKLFDLQSEKIGKIYEKGDQILKDQTKMFTEFTKKLTDFFNKK